MTHTSHMVSGVYTTKSRKIGYINSHWDSKKLIVNNNIGIVTGTGTGTGKGFLGKLRHGSLDLEEGQRQTQGQSSQGYFSTKKRYFSSSFRLLLFLGSVFFIVSLFAFVFQLNESLSTSSSLVSLFRPSSVNIPLQPSIEIKRALTIRQTEERKDIATKNLVSTSQILLANDQAFDKDGTERKHTLESQENDKATPQKEFKNEGGKKKRPLSWTKGKEIYNTATKQSNSFPVGQEFENGKRFDEDIKQKNTTEKYIIKSLKTFKSSCDILIFTMDSIDQYITASKKGGPGGEIIIRKSLMAGLQELYGCKIHVANSDVDFEKKMSLDYIRVNVMNNEKKYTLIFVDPWTWAGKGWKVKKPLEKYESKVFILNFFGTLQVERNVQNEWKEIPNHRILTAFKTTPWNTFLGYFYEEDDDHDPKLFNKIGQGVIEGQEQTKQIAQGVIWGKDPAHFDRTAKELILKLAQKNITLHSVVSSNSPLARQLNHPNIHFHGHLMKEDWYKLLDSSFFLLGLGNPLLGPSAVDAIRHGCVYINPMYPVNAPKLKRYFSQHPYLETEIGKPYVCSANLDNFMEVKNCIDFAYLHPFQGFTPKDFIKEQYLIRLHEIVKDYF